MASSRQISREADWREGRGIPGFIADGRPDSNCARAFKSGESRKIASIDSSYEPNYDTPNERSVGSFPILFFRPQLPHDSSNRAQVHTVASLGVLAASSPEPGAIEMRLENGKSLGDLFEEVAQALSTFLSLSVTRALPEVVDHSDRRPRTSAMGVFDASNSDEVRAVIAVRRRLATQMEARFAGNGLHEVRDGRLMCYPRKREASLND